MANTFSPQDFLKKLTEQKHITEDLAKQYQVESLKKDLPIDDYLQKYTTLSSEVLTKTKAELLQVPYINLKETAIDHQALSFLPQSMAERHTIVPYLYDQKGRTLYIATSDPLNVSLLDYLETKAGTRVILVLADKEDIEETINTAYNRNLSPEIKEAVANVAPFSTQQQKQEIDNIDSAPIAKIVNTILSYAIKSRASDIHIEPLEVKTRVRYRIDGILQEKLSLPASIHSSLVSRIKILSQIKIDEKRVPQDGRFNFKTDEQEVDLRVSTLPTVHGEKVVMRLLKKSGGMPTLDELGLQGVQLDRFKTGITKSYGIVLITGPTGSGKTTTLYSVLSKLNTKAVNIVTLEDPVEYQIEGINQVQINPQAGLTFANGLKSFLRQDPNIILVGEIRDEETTLLAVQAALTGHLVFSTLHTNDSATAVPRLIDLGGQPFLLASVINMSVAQRIVRKICEHCKEYYEPPAEVQESIREIVGDHLPKEVKDGAPIRLAKGRKCEECNHTGYTGRVGIFEILLVSPSINALVLKEASSQEIEKKAVEEGMILMKQDGYIKALQGITTIEEIMRVTEEER